MARLAFEEEFRRDRISAILRRVGPDLAAYRIAPDDLKSIVALMTHLFPSAAPWANREVMNTLRLYGGAANRSDASIAGDLDLLARTDDLERIYLVHWDGHVREAALAKMTGPIDTPFLLAAIAYRLNDWSAVVRQVAADCVARRLPSTSDAVVEVAAPYLRQARTTWLRGGQSEALDAILARTA